MDAGCAENRNKVTTSVGVKNRLICVMTEETSNIGVVAEETSNIVVKTEETYNVGLMTKETSNIGVMTQKIWPQDVFFALHILIIL